MKYNVNVHKKEKGFTLLEILLVIAAIGILAAIVIVAINPTQQLGKARDAERASEINTISNAIYQYFIDAGMFPNNLNETAAINDLPIANVALADGDCAIPTVVATGGNAGGQNYVQLSSLVPNYIGAIPSDPSNPTANGTKCTGYIISKSSGSSGRITITAPMTEIATPDLSITR